MTKITKYTIEIKGMFPLMMNRLSRELNNELAEVPNSQRVEWDEKNYEKKLYTDSDGNIRFPAMNIHAMLQECAKKYKVKAPKDVGRTWTAYIKGAIVVEDVGAIDHSSVEPYGCMVNGNPSSSKGASKVYRIRPIIHDWSFKFSFTDAGNMLNEKAIEGMLSNGGLMVGCGDWRPQWGRFKVVSVKSNEVTL